MLITVFSQENNVQAVSDFLLENTTTIGVRSYPVSRQILPRTIKTVKTSLGDVDVKEVALPSGKSRITIEYESANKIAKQLDRPVSEIFSLLYKEV